MCDGAAGNFKTESESRSLPLQSLIAFRSSWLGTGTHIGDQEETKALTEFFGPKCNNDHKILVGSVKTNIGHLESSAGTAGLIKVLLMMKHNQIVPSLHCTKAKCVIDSETSPLMVSSDVSVWLPLKDGSRISCLNCFGFGGTNSHVIIRQDTQPPMQTANENNIVHFMIAITAASQPALRSILKHFLHKLQTCPYNISDLSYTSLLKRDQHRYRMVYAVQNIKELEEKITLTIERKEDVIPNVNGSKIIAIFCGVGTVWEGMCKDFMLSNKTFLKTVQEIDLELRKYTEISMVKVLQNQTSSIETDAFLGPLAIFVCQIALYRMWQEIGVLPDIIIGQSIGEVAAAYSAGCLTLPEAVKITYYRSVLSANATGGRMLLVGKCNIPSLQDILNSYKDKLSIAVYSSDEAVVVSGDINAIKEIKTNLSSNSNFPSVLLKELNVKCAYHSHHMLSASKTLANKLNDLPGRKPTSKILSTMTGVQIVGPEMCSAEYWSQNLVKPVLLRDAVSNAIDPEKRNIFLEIGPKPVLRAHLEKITDADAIAVPSCDNDDPCKVFAKAAALLHTNEIKLNLSNIVPQHGILTDIPRYKFYRSGQILSSDALRATLQCIRTKRSNHPFISQTPLSDGYQVVLSKESTPYIYEHTLDQMHIAPGALHLEIGLVVANSFAKQQLSEISLCTNFVKPLVITKQQKVDLNVIVSKENSSFEIEHKTDTLCKGYFFQRNQHLVSVVSISHIKKTCTIFISQDEFYENLRELGFVYGPSLTVVINSWRSDTDFLAEIRLPDDVMKEGKNMHLHPCISDGILQTMAIPLLSSKDQGLDKNRDKATRLIPIKVGALTLKMAPEKDMYVYGRLIEFTPNHVVVNALLLSKRGELVAEVVNYEVRNVAYDISNDLLTKSYETKWLKMNTNETITTDLDRILCICQTDTSLNLCQNYFSSTSCITMLLDIPEERVRDGKIYETFLSVLEGKHMNPTNFQQIVYFPGFRQSSKLLDTDKVYQCVRLSSLVLLDILKGFVDDGIDKPIFIVTERTQPSLQDEHYIYNVVGSELWGMCRCLVRERTYSNLKLVDLSNDFDIDSLGVIFVKTRTDDFWRHSPEFKISDKKIYINQVQRFNEDARPTRMNHYNYNQPLELRSKQDTNLDELFLVAKSHESEEIQHVTLKVEQAVVNPDTGAITTTSAVDDPDPWKLSRPEGHPVIAGEICGTLCNNNEYGTAKLTGNCLKSSKTHPMTIQNQDISFVTCFPCIISNTVQVPKDCVIPRKQFPMYTPGLMHKCITYLALIEELKTGLPVGIIYEKLSKSNILLLQFFCRLSKIKVAFMIEITGFVNNYNMEGKYQVMLLLENITRSEKCCCKLRVTASRVVTSSNYMNKPSERLFRQTLPNIEISIINHDDIISQHKLPKLAKKLGEWLPKTSNCFEDASSPQNCKPSGNVIKFKSSSLITMPNEIHAEQLPVRIGRSTMFNKFSGYMVIGGLTGLGWETVQLLARTNGGCIAILSRSEATEERKIEIKDLSDIHQCHIISIRADISNYESLKSAFEEYHNRCINFPLKGVFQGAAIVDDELLMNMTSEKFERVLKPKILGTLNLHNLSQEMNLDYFVLQSSVTSVFGNNAQINYGAGNAFMDTFAYYRKSIGLSGQTINWGVLNLGLGTASDHVQKHLRNQGYNTLSSEEILECICHTLSSNITQIVYGIFDWERMVRKSPGIFHQASKLQPLLSELKSVGMFVDRKGAKITVNIQELQGLHESDRIRKIEEVLSVICSDIFAVELQIIKVSTKFEALGIDSMKAMAFRNTVYEHFSCQIPFVKVLEPDTDIASIASLLSFQIDGCSDTERIGPVKQMKQLKYLSDENKLYLNTIERDCFNFESIDEKHFSFILAEVRIVNESIRKDEVEMAFNKLVLAWPELASVYVKDGDNIFRVYQTQSNAQETGQQVDHRFIAQFSKDEIDSTFHDALIYEDGTDIASQDLESRDIIFEGKVIKVEFVRRNNDSIVRLHCDRVLFNQMSTRQLCFDFLSILEGKMIDTKMLETQQEIDEIFDKPKTESIKYWSSILSCHIDPVILTKQSDTVNKFQGVQIQSTVLSSEVSTSAQNYFKKHAITSNEFLIAAYHVLLHIVSGNAVVSVASYVNLRDVENSNLLKHPENMIPFISVLKQNVNTFTQFLQYDVKNIRMATEMGFLSHSTLEKMFMNQLTAENAFQHGFCVDEMFLNTQPDAVLKSTEIKRISSFDSRFHTVLHICKDQRTDRIQLALHFNPETIAEETVSQWLEGMSKMVEVIVGDRDLTIASIQQIFKPTMNSNGRQHIHHDLEFDTIVADPLDETTDEPLEYRGVFMKETSYGWDHRVTLEVSTDREHGKILQWKKDSVFPFPSKPKQLDWRSILHATRESYNGIHIVTFETKTREHAFKTADIVAHNSLWQAVTKMKVWAKQNLQPL